MFFVSKYTNFYNSTHTCYPLIAIQLIPATQFLAINTYTRDRINKKYFLKVIKKFPLPPFTFLKMYAIMENSEEKG